MQKLCCVRTRQHPLPVWSHKFVLSSTTHIATNSHPFLVGIVSRPLLNPSKYLSSLREGYAAVSLLIPFLMPISSIATGEYPVGLDEDMGPGGTGSGP